ncbi:MAG: F0F1 ATP synthase subunit B [Anaerolineaceae bacterium]|nr:F0F1 ATP synthase subunit B [Anaerolineaceae bacterium]
MEGLGINLGYLIVQILNFAILFVVIYAWAVKPIVGMLKSRRETIARGLEDARVAEEARANAELDAEKIITEAQKKATEIVREATERAEIAGKEVQTAAEAVLVKDREVAKAELEQERDRTLSELRGQVALLAIAAAQKLSGESLLADESRQHELLEEFFSGVKSGKVVVLEGAELAGTSAEVTSALPLTADEQEIVKRDILASVGGGATISFRVDPSILGGLVVRVGDRVVDGSVAAQLQELRQSM